MNHLAFHVHRMFFDTLPILNTEVLPMSAPSDGNKHISLSLSNIELLCPVAKALASPMRVRMIENAAFAASAHIKSCGRKSVPASKRSPAALSAGTMDSSITASGSFCCKARSVASCAGWRSPLSTASYRLICCWAEAGPGAAAVPP